MASSINADDLVVFATERTDLPVAPADAPAGWKVLVVDDEPDVHVVTRLALDDVVINGRRLHFLNAHSAAEARELLAGHDDIAVVLLDVVMETEKSGFEVVHFLRHDLGRTETRIILRTGQPGLAPEIDAIRDCDINDYKSKGELTRTRLFSSVTVAIRSYDQIRTISASRRGLGHVVAATGALLSRRELPAFAHEVLVQFAGLLQRDAAGLVVARRVPGDEMPVVVAAAGAADDSCGCRLDALPAGPRRDLIEQAWRTRRPIRDGRGEAFPITGQTGDMIVLLDPAKPSDPVEQGLIDAFCTNAAIAFDNVVLYGRLSALAFIDQLTGLPNRQGFVAGIDARIDGAAARGGRVVLIDVDGFGEVNNVLGHDQGDELLIAIADRLRQRFPSDVAIARVGADTFGLLGDEATIEPAGVLALFDDPLPLRGAVRLLKATIGAVDIGQITGDGRTVLRKTDLALRRAKQDHRGGFGWFRSADAIELRARLHLLDELRAALTAGELSVAYQPQVTLSGGRIAGFEALARWRTRDGRDISPALFIPLAEQSGLIVELGRQILDRALADLALLRRRDSDLTMAVNMSMVEFQDADTLDHVRAALRASGLPGSALEIELTESLAAEDAVSLARRMKSFRDEGIQIAIDDFGTGFSSLSRLASLPLDRLKIDRSFLAGVEHPGSQRTIVAVMLELARAFGLAVVAEGVETPGQLHALAALGCSLAQGYHLARPMSFDALVGWLGTQGQP